MNDNSNRGSFSGNIGFVLAAAGSAVGLGNIWRFPYLAAKDNGGVFILVYIILALTFGFTLLTTEIAIGRKTGQGPLTAYGVIHKKWKGIGVLAWLVPVLILPYYCTIGGWVLKYLTVYVTGQAGAAVGDSYFTDYITSNVSPIVFGLVFLAFTALVVFLGVDKGIERVSKILMPILFVLIIGISIYSLTLSHDTGDGTVRTGLQGLKIYVVPNFDGMTFRDFCLVVMDAMGQLFFSISVAMGIMVAYGSYVKKDVNLMKSINQIEIFDTIVAFLAGLMIIPAVYVFSGTEGMSGGPGSCLYHCQRYLTPWVQWEL
jgi:NSS family neurotransmitter:Na+ symporter